MAVHFFTGFPGFITRQLIGELFQKNITDSVYVLVLRTEMKKAEKVREKILETYPGRRIEIIEGDITVPKLNLKEEDNQSNCKGSSLFLAFSGNL